jgi:A/G-specific adenine glycosylase
MAEVWPKSLIDALVAPLVQWYGKARRDLPWRRTTDPYAIWLSETMLQQTRVETVLPYYERFLSRMPSVASLAEATEDEVLNLWSGLGYYRRARMLHAAARRVAREHGGRLPSTVEQLRELEGVGPYTAGAVASIAFGRRAPLVDGNVARVLARLFAVREDIKGPGAARVWDIAGKLVEGNPGHPGDWNQALMELGATVCTPQPRCEACPVAGACRARAAGIERELPVVSPKRAPVPVRRVALVLASPDAVLLARRKRDALFGGLWEPPGIDAPSGRARALRELTEALGLEARVTKALRHAADVEHVLTHRRLTVAVVTGRLSRRRLWPVPGDEYDEAAVVPVSRLARHARSTLATKILVASGMVKPAAVELRSGSP